MAHYYGDMASAPGTAQRMRFAFSRRAPRSLAALGAAMLVGFAVYGATRFGASAAETPTPVAAQGSRAGDPASASVTAPQRLSETGLYLPGNTLAVDPRNLSYVPQYPLWSDGAEKRRYIRLPEGQAIDASDAERWQFPAGTRFWKEFRFGNRPAETRYMERQGDGSWTYATYVWNAAGTDAERAPERGLRGVLPLAGGVRHDVPSRTDCQACHEGRPGAVLGFNSLQLSQEPDPLAPHREAPPPGAVDLVELARRGLVEHLPVALLERPPRIQATTQTERAALGYLFGNCSGCHNSAGPLAPLGLDFDPALAPSEHAPRASATSVGQVSQFRPPGAKPWLRIAPGRPEDSLVAFRMRSRNPAEQMPPLGTHLVDREGLALIERWISEDL